MFDIATNYISKKLLDLVWTHYTELHARHYDDMRNLSDEFGPLDELISYYIEPDCQNINPANVDEEEPIFVARQPAFSLLNAFFNSTFVNSSDGRNQLFLLSDAGLGKSSLFLIIKLCSLLPNNSSAQDFNNNPVVLLKINSQTLSKVRSLERRSETILLLDALDEDPLTWNHPEKRLVKILQATMHFRRVCISCRTQFFPEKGVRTYGSQ